MRKNKKNKTLLLRLILSEVYKWLLSDSFIFYYLFKNFDIFTTNFYLQF